MTDKSEPTRHDTLLRLEDKVNDLCAAVYSADFLIEKLVIEGAETKGGDDRVFIEIGSAQFSALSYQVANLYSEAKAFSEFFFQQWAEGGGFFR
jgi:hypothetical protein